MVRMWHLLFGMPELSHQSVTGLYHMLKTFRGWDKKKFLHYLDDVLYPEGRAHAGETAAELEAYTKRMGRAFDELDVESKGAGGGALGFQPADGQLLLHLQEISALLLADNAAEKSDD
jgi:hypothetical protein